MLQMSGEESNVKTLEEIERQLLGIQEQRMVLITERSELEEELVKVKASFRTEHSRVWSIYGEGEEGRHEWMEVKQSLLNKQREIKVRITQLVLNMGELKTKRMRLNFDRESVKREQ